MIRIISGTHKGRRLQAPRKLPVRPTTDRAKESLFNILAAGMDWPEARVLDLFAGTGNISYECASRGCMDITAVDAHGGCVGYIRDTALELGMPILAVKADVLSYLRRGGPAFDFIFADPPYELTADEFTALVAAVFEAGLLKEDGILVVEHPSQVDLGGLPGFAQARKYGGTMFSFFGRP